ncbi:aromatic-ring-hydroxylating dioxygenase subunit beta [Mycobacteroides franklinii]|uniref:Biphenyl dioxygenase subunit beta n=1 Tax=Mycobacteroides franklinii TaxID=948102 RepID=A0A4R8R598_9MYCO|nr:aromatic-ring-hydroxylating dioxygenase subunit beta [Mycobacteroides franklinii]ORA62986.1 ring-hydroxylating dioxygenase subunit beta [Mycobacteroides franklinii]TDH22393.1 ring-hydroxylating dioxygenase subunit beta [Mycobacteroides franklinii]TDZ44020.1 Biphenyl dioxygenase subunit beta [Mycobacteroides franklinii]TDZ51154.1 Biphenyl dioxygenase subunit beta [Mycobacteroides franklinii]TDZ57574.1 Biphenyl dioxygenase subunit beta [Mycobacteroides franklinii]
MSMSLAVSAELLPVPDSLDRCEVEQFLYREARYADEADYDAWEALWTDDALYWVPASTVDPLLQMSIIYDNRSRISTRLKQARTGRRYAQAPPSRLRRLISNIELLGMRSNSMGGSDLEIEANFLVMEARPRGTHLWAGRTTYRVRRVDEDLRLSYKKVVLIDNDQPVPTLGFLI